MIGLESQRDRVSIIIPTLNEEETVVKLLGDLAAHRHDWLDVTVVDGGSTDRTVEVVSAFEKVTLIHGPKGRAVQMNA